MTGDRKGLDPAVLAAIITVMGGIIIAVINMLFLTDTDTVSDIDQCPDRDDGRYGCSYRYGRRRRPHLDARAGYSDPRAFLDSRTSGDRGRLGE